MHYYIAGQSMLEIDKIRKQLSFGQTNGLVIMSSDMYQSLVPISGDEPIQKLIYGMRCDGSILKIVEDINVLEPSEELNEQTS